MLKRKKFSFVLQNKEFEIYISTITPINAFYTTRKEKGKDAAFKAVEGLLKLVEIRSNVTNRFYKMLLRSTFTDYEDAVQHECAVAENLDAIVTRNMKDYKNSSVKIYSPTEFLQIV